MKILFTLLFTTLITASYAQPGTIDKSYGIDNTGTVAVPNTFYVQSSAMQPDNRLLLGGGSIIVAGQYSLSRHNKDGTIDTSFGNGGQANIAINDLVNNIQGSDGWQNIAIEPDSKIVATGSVYFYNPDFPGDGFKLDNDIVIAQFLPNGTPDESFGSHGRVVTNLGYIETATAIAVQADGKIVVAGYQDLDIDGNGSGIVLVRYNQDGSLDESFGEGRGYVKYTKTDSRAFAMLIQPDGKIVAGGTEGASDYFFLVRYMPDGTIDATFGEGGQVKTGFGLDIRGVQINSLALDEKGRIVAAGVVGTNRTVEVARYLPDGVLDNSFDDDGKLELRFAGAAFAYTNTVFAHPDNKLIVSSIISYNGNDWQLALSGLNADGSSDTSFGTDGGRTITNTNSIDIYNTTAAMQTDGRIIISGNSLDDNTNINTYELTRFNGYPTQVPLYVRIKRWLKNHGISWRGLPAQNGIAYYSVEQSADGRTGFQSIAKVSGRNQLNNYDLTNSHLLQGTNYYRIKAVSGDGAIRYSEVVSADNTVTSASVYPNPVRDYVTVRGLKSNEQANISIANGSGTVVARGVSNGSVQYRTTAGNLQPGTYYLNITTGGGKTETLKFVKE